MSTAAQQEVTTPVKAAKGDFVWHELRTTDAKGAEDFYTHVVGWQAKPSGDPGGMPYTIYKNGSTFAGEYQAVANMDLARCRLEEARDQPQRRRLAAAGGAQKADQLPVIDTQ